MRTTNSGEKFSRVLSVGLFVLAAVVGGVAGGMLYQAEPPKKIKVDPRSPTNADQPDPIGAAGSIEATDCVTTKDAESKTLAAVDSSTQPLQPACPPESKRPGFSTLDTPWSQLAITGPQQLFGTLGEEGRAVAESLNETFDSMETFDALRECQSHLRPPVGDPVENFECNLIFDLESSNGELRLVGSDVQDMTFSDNQIVGCLRDVYMRHEVLGGDEGQKPAKDFRIRVSWPISLGVPKG